VKKECFPIEYSSFYVRKTFGHRAMSQHKILDRSGPVQVTGQLCALGIMTKAPQAGKVKTRLTPPLTGKEAAQLNICFLRDLGQSISEAARHSAAKGVGVYTPVGAHSAYGGILSDEFVLLPQRGDNFGERLLLAAEDLFKVGFTSVCLINSDSPTVPASSFVEATKELSKAGDRVVLGPSDDGGYYLIGLKQMHRRVFEGIDWSTARVLNQTKERAAEIGVDIHEIPSGFDVDDRATLRRLCEELFAGASAARQDIAPNTCEFLAKILEREGRDRIWPQ
jgi:rSAM/selenodomain-associated transferase 1